MNRSACGFACYILTVLTVLTILDCSSPGQTAPTFTRSDITVGSHPVSLAVADFNGDGKLDIAVLADTTGLSILSIYLGDGNGNFTFKSSFSTGFASTWLTAGDLNGDGLADLVVAGFGFSRSVSIFLATRGGAFGPRSDISLPGRIESVLLADFNADGKLDLAAPNFELAPQPSVSILLGNGDGTFGPNTEYLTLSTPFVVIADDFNSDGKLDLAINGQFGGVSVLLGNGDGTFQSKKDSSSGFAQSSGLASGDLNNDGKPDLVVTNNADDSISILLGNGDGTFNLQPPLPVSAGPFRLAIRDVNTDAKPDVLVAVRSSANVSVFPGKGDGTFGAPSPFDTGAGPQFLVDADLNGDKLPDLVTANFDAGTMSILLNTSGASPCASQGGDTDGDGLCDDWERFGYTVNVNGVPVFVDLPAMGADPNHKDIFVQADYMVDPGLCLPIIGCFLGHTHKPKLDAIAMVTQAFANAPVTNPDGTTGIRLHVDCGADCVMNPVSGELWGAHSQSHSLVHIDTLGTTSRPTPEDLLYDWSAFQKIKAAAKFSPARASAFHYALWAHELGGELICRSGNSRILGSDFIVSLGGLLCPWSDNVGTTLQQAGTFMHELGHNLSLQHGGADPANYKPNYLSVMNYLFQTSGLAISGAPGNLDYSRFLLPSLNENSLNENVGLNGGVALTNYGTSFFCAGAAKSDSVANANGPIDWNCNGVSNEINLATDINNNGSLETLSSFNDWPHLVFKDGAIGELGLAANLPTQTAPQQEITPEIDSHITKLISVAVTGAGVPRVLPGISFALSFTVINGGTKDDVYHIVTASDVTWGDVTSVPASLSLSAGASRQVIIPVTVPVFATPGIVGHFSLRASSQTSPPVADSAEVSATIVTGPAITVSAAPATLWPPNGNMVPVTVSGTITGTQSGVNASTAFYAVNDEYGLVYPSGTVSLGQGGIYSFTIYLQASRHGDDKNGRQYIIKVSAEDNTGIPGSASTTVTVPHDKGK